MSERLHVCQALAAMIRQHGEPNEEEVTFIGMAAMQLGLTEEENSHVRRTLKKGGDFVEALNGITSSTMRAFLLRRLLAATLLDEHINEEEQAFIDQTTAAFGMERQRVDELIAWMKVNIEVEHRIAGLLGAVEPGQA